MDSVDDMYDTNNVDSSEDFYSEDDNTATASDEDDSEGDDLIMEAAKKPLKPQKQNYAILSEADIGELQKKDITVVSDALKISEGSASIILQHHNWSEPNNFIHDTWFCNQEKIRKAVGLPEETTPIPDVTVRIKCRICLEECPRDSVDAAACGHPFCNSCWKRYITISINDGPGCLVLRCPEPSCGAAVVKEMIKKHVDDDDAISWQKYGRYLVRSYVEAKQNKIKWCPAPGCDYAVKFDIGRIGTSGISNDVKCDCSYGFCWSCAEEAHRPVDCATVAKWILKNSAESENTNWILVNSKPCPKCKRPIEKNHGCMHMTCTPPCNFQFCWLCLGAWSEHGERTGGHYACNRYETAKQKGAYDVTERRREMAKNSLERYTHYYERWAANQKSRQKALADLHQMQAVQLDQIREKQCQIHGQVMFIIDAWKQIVECRRVLKWTYAYAYYLPERERVKREFFEYLQGEAESGLERLHQCAEKELEIYLNEGLSKEFDEFRTKLAGLTSVTKNYFENLVQALENNLEDVDSKGGCSKVAGAGSKSFGEGCSKGSGKRGKRAASRSGG
ncbi:hypothetical protein Sjap_008774 [Stephania japonica]|uniref:RBR-type E3 ubiquitin transferase n=1 Tax=Stephania japonica TaxID=461633 RepID=A0AAP0JSG3_9MAGN